MTSQILDRADQIDTEYPHLQEQDGLTVPSAPIELSHTGLPRDVFADLCLKFAHTVPRCSARWVSDQVCLPLQLVEELLMELAHDHLLEVLGMESPSNHRYAVTQRGHERALGILRASRYLGPAPVSLEQYTSMIHVQKSWFTQPSFQQVQEALSNLVLPDGDVLIAATALIAERSLFLWGPAGNGKTSVARALHEAVAGEFWIPHAIGVGHDIIQLFDPHVHRESNHQFSRPWAIDRRWVRVQRPLIVVGGEMTLDTLELSFNSDGGFYEAPLHAKANHGMFVIDDFGRQRVDPWDLLNRWIVPMEHSFDYLMLRSGRKISVPFELMLIIATNIDPNKVMDPAFLRRLGYRIQITRPTEERYREIFAAVAAKNHLAVPDGLLDRLLERYRQEKRELAACEPRDLISRVCDICCLRNQPFELNDELLGLAWFGYFGTST